MKLNTSQGFSRSCLTVFFAVLAILYVGFHGRYLVEYIDNVWTFSWAWNLFEHGEYRDLVFGEQNGGTLFFQRTPAMLYGAIASLVGWTQGIGFGISKFFTLAAAVLWYFIVCRLGYRRQTALTFAGIMLMLEIYFGMANKIRQEPMAFFLCSAAFLLFLRGNFLLTGLALGIAIESHPFAVVGGIWLLAYLISIWSKIKTRLGEYALKLLLCAIGLGLGFGYWFLLHSSNSDTMWGKLVGRIEGNIFIEYFLKRRYAWRHWPELVIIAAASAFFIFRKKYVAHPFVLPFFISMLIFPFLLTRGNLHYMVYIYPAAILLILTAAEDLKLTPVLLIGIMLFQVPQYAWLFWWQRHYNHSEFLTNLQNTVPESVEFIYGNPNAWYAFPEKDFHAYGYFGRSNLPLEQWPEKFIVIETSDFERWLGRGDMNKIEGLYDRDNLAEWSYWDGAPVRVYSLSKKNFSPSE